MMTCGSCHREFQYKDLKIKETTYGGTVKVKEKCCPYCGHIGFTADCHLRYFDSKEERI